MTPDLHTPRRLLLHAVLIAICFVVAISGALLYARPAHADLTALSRGLRTEYAVPGGPLNIAVEAPGRIWFTAPEEDAIGQLVVTSALNDPITTYVVNFIVLEPGSDPYDIEFLDGAIYFTERGGNRIGRIDVATHELTRFDIPTPNSAPTGIDAAPNGTLWFTEREGKKLVNFDPQSGTFVEYPFVGSVFAGRNVLARDVAVQDDDVIWFTGPTVNTVFAYYVSLGQFFDVPTGADSRPNNITIDSIGRAWITTEQSSRVGRYAPGTLALWSWRNTHVANSGPAGLVFRNNGSTWDIWYAQNNVGLVGRLTVSPSGQFRSMIDYPLSSADSRPWGIAIDASQSVWIAETGGGRITELRFPYAYQMYMPAISGPVAVPIAEP
jgi:streptogramin lyase